MFRENPVCIQNVFVMFSFFYTAISLLYFNICSQVVNTCYWKYHKDYKSHNNLIQYGWQSTKFDKVHMNQLSKQHFFGIFFWWIGWPYGRRLNCYRLLNYMLHTNTKSMSILWNKPFSVRHFGSHASLKSWLPILDFQMAN